MENMGISVTVLLTGIVVVFAMLVLLIGLIKLYSTIVYNAQKKSEDKKKQKEMVAKMQTEKPVEPVIEEISQDTQDGISGEVIAAIAAAVDYIYGEGTTTIKSIKKRPQARSAWSTAGLIDNTRPF